MDEKSRIDKLIEIQNDLIAKYGQDSYFMADLNKILDAVNGRIDDHRLRVISNAFKGKV